MHNMKHETIPTIVIRARIIMLDEAINNVRRLSSAPSRFPSASSKIDVCIEGANNGSNYNHNRIKLKNNTLLAVLDEL